jgi:hypothetical protein
LAPTAWIGRDKDATALSFSNKSGGGGRGGEIKAWSSTTLRLLAPESIDSTPHYFLPQQKFQMYMCFSHLPLLLFLLLLLLHLLLHLLVLILVLLFLLLLLLLLLQSPRRSNYN